MVPFLVVVVVPFLVVVVVPFLVVVVGMTQRRVTRLMLVAIVFPFIVMVVIVGPERDRVEKRGHLENICAVAFRCFEDVQQSFLEAEAVCDDEVGLIEGRDLAR